MRAWLLLVVACGTPTPAPQHAAISAMPDAAIDAVKDAAVDASIDAAEDVIDAGPPEEWVYVYSPSSGRPTMSFRTKCNQFVARRSVPVRAWTTVDKARAALERIAEGRFTIGEVHEEADGVHVEIKGFHVQGPCDLWKDLIESTARENHAIVTFK